MKTSKSDKSKTKKSVTYGWELVLDLYECDPGKISDGKHIKLFAKELCREIDMKPYGKPYAPYFGENAEHTKGYSLLQFIETSSITGHFSESTGAVYLNVFSCRPYDRNTVKKFAKDWFGAKKVKTRFLTRE